LKDEACAAAAGGAVGKVGFEGGGTWSRMEILLDAAAAAAAAVVVVVILPSIVVAVSPGALTEVTGVASCLICTVEAGVSSLGERD